MSLTPAALHARPAGKTAVVDVRSPGEYAAGHVPGAVNVPLDAVTSLLPELTACAAHRDLVLVCAAGQRSATARDLLADAGVDAAHLTGGTDAWREAGLPLDTPEGADAPASRVWAMDRQVRFTAGSLILLGLAVGQRAPRARLLAAGVAGGLVYSGLSNTCGLAAVLGRLPFNRTDSAVLDAARRALRP